MIRIMAMDETGELHYPKQIDDLLQKTWNWYWVDFSTPTPDEAQELERFSFHPLAVKDCYYYTQKPKLDYYDDYQFFVLQAMNQTNYQAEEVDLFISPTFVLTFHYDPRPEIDIIWERLCVNEEGIRNRGTHGITYKIIDKLVDNYFPVAQNMEDQLTEFEAHILNQRGTSHHFMREIFRIRGHLLDLRMAIWPMRDLLYRTLNSHRMLLSAEERFYYSDIHDHLIKLAGMIESSGALANDIRDHYLSVNSHRMNLHMMTLTIITVIFMPLTFIAGIYGMNFKYMPELEWKYGYFAVLLIMLVIGLILFYNFKRKGWFNSD
ncbi:magnesium transporter [Seinonella peptonophila]|uniref:Magnesium transport protein CorA n=1 Tax=Seinonella peptonophila TaxID=112248 RepID=A0A1M4XPZ9_9BACL|nr:magnesium/cobalt transporter CorA [Seinonella peptonophila]SHE95510.1 magnesium transporter [Seinonella peptonophila]